MKEGLVLIKRGDYVESFHRVHLVVVNDKGETIFTRGKEGLNVCMRSSAKPFQAIPVVIYDVDKTYGLTEEELAIFSGSINAEEHQVEVVREILRKAGLDESYLKCGPSYPSYKKYAEKLKAEGIKPAPIYHNCAGKHAGMLIVSKAKGYDLNSYFKEEHPLQQEILEIIAEYAEMKKDDIKLVTDGCGLPVYFMPLKNIAVAYKNLSMKLEIKDGKVKRLIKAALKNPDMVAGTDRLCTDIIKITDGRIFAKVGAEALYGAFNCETKEGLAFKVEDGGQRALNIFMVVLLKKLGWINDYELEKLSKYINLPIRNSRNDVVGKVEAIV